MVQTRNQTKLMNIINFELENYCPCGGGQSCIVDRRGVGDWVHEDDVFIRNNISLRKDCYTPYSDEQYNVMKIFLPKNNKY